MAAATELLSLNKERWEAHVASQEEAAPTQEPAQQVEAPTAGMCLMCVCVCVCVCVCECVCVL